ncbi:hypothetical protein HN371_23730 [Candidatus Poribacteria bacterium]|jgi:hypothetical protein|nr:hypothetical protein [Candidatus Poribacteria bacterium]MBT5534111.1 hypothetical protein [Candidatus Poribacteria bacterium]MBT5713638.1 hypothetical protein [Candidatus Poribacteria bacterium]MBT7101657.1 hypothetical protein [Candidatus Poribacteria bacterium]MBT7806855.1 hypothetical protein [Candidatus Poribacteria bacterium]
MTRYTLTVCLALTCASAWMACAVPPPVSDSARTAEEAPPRVVTLKHDDGTMDGKRSIAGSGHAVLFDRPDGEWDVTRVQVYGSRYGYPQAPDEDFNVYIADADMNVLAQVGAPYARFARGEWAWVLVDVPATAAPEQFYVCVTFDPAQTKGVYVGCDESVTQTHSKRALPGAHVADVNGAFDWMIRAVIAPRAAAPAPVE